MIRGFIRPRGACRMQRILYYNFFLSTIFGKLGFPEGESSILVPGFSAEHAVAVHQVLNAEPGQVYQIHQQHSHWC